MVVWRYFKGIVFRFVNSIYLFWVRESSDRLIAGLASCGENVLVDKTVTVWGAGGVCLGDDVVINGNTFIFGSGGVLIGDRVQISAGCVITSVTHPKAVGSRREMLEKKVVVGDDVWIGAGSIILPGVSVGKGAIIGAGALVSRDVPEFSVVYGERAIVRGRVCE